MRKPTVAITASTPEWSLSLQGILAGFLDDRVEFLSAPLSVIPERSTLIDIAFVADPGMDGSLREELAPHDVDVVVVHYTLPKKAWQTVQGIPYSSSVQVCGEPHAAHALGDALARLGRTDLDLEHTGDCQAVGGTGLALSVTTPAPAAQNMQLLIDPPVPATASILELLWLLGRYDSSVLTSLRRYMQQIEPLREDAQYFLDRAVELKTRLDTAMTFSKQPMIHYDKYHDVVDVSGPVEELFQQPGQHLRGLPIRELCKELAELSLSAHAGRPSERVVHIQNKTLIARIESLGDQESFGGGVINLSPPAFRPRPKPAERAPAPMPVVQPLQARHRLEDLIAQDPVMVAVKRRTARLRDSISPVLILGEPGTGKRLLAEAIHNISPRAGGPFVAFNCAAIAGTPAEAELFGYGPEAARPRTGTGAPHSLFELANRGTLLLKEIGDLSTQAQAMLLRAIEGDTPRRSGRSAPMDVRVVAAVSEPLAAAVASGAFRRDLYHYLDAIPIRMPPLRERLSDVPLLAERLLAKLGDGRRLGARVMSCLTRYPWPGNVRELRHCIEYLVTTADGEFTVADLPAHVRPQLRRRKDPAEGGDTPPPVPPAAQRTAQAAGQGAVQPQAEAHDIDRNDLFILREVAVATRHGRGVGRRSLARQAARAGLQLSENDVRSRLQSLGRRGLIEPGKGRAGTRLTDAGRALLKQMTGAAPMSGTALAKLRSSIARHRARAARVRYRDPD